MAIDPVGSVFYNLFYDNELIEPGRYHVEGIGSDTPCQALDMSTIDEIIQVDDHEAFKAARRLVLEEGLIVGGSSGSAVAGLYQWARERSGRLNIVTILADTGTRYLSKFLNDDWMKEHAFDQ